MYIVAGDSRYKDVSIPVIKIIGEIAAAIGLELLDEMPFRSMRTSPQQGGKQDLRESLLVLSRERLAN